LAAPVQSYENHRRFVPAFHFVALGILVVNLVWQIVRLVRELSIDAAVGLLVAVALLLMLFYSRTFSLILQDRIIRQEERLRLARLCPELAARIPELRRGQLIALRFASDEELPALVRRVLDEGITDQDVIKKAIRNWRADTLRV
jgi:Family of unknown function (DUF6526)